MIESSIRPTYAPLCSGQKVKILYPPYVAGLNGTTIAPEEDGNGVHSGCWLVRVDQPEMILALTFDEVDPLST